jgi:uncharacterized membrane protein YhaH (DUF805 family)
MTASDWFSFSGRITRKQHWLNYVLLIVLIEIVIVGADAVLRLRAPARGLASNFALVFQIVEVVAFIVIFFGGMAGSVKRLHDRDRRGWFYLLILVPLLGPLWMFIEIGFLRGTRGPNRFGPDPLAAQPG